MAESRSRRHVIIERALTRETEAGELVFNLGCRPAFDPASQGSRIWYPDQRLNPGGLLAQALRPEPSLPVLEAVAFHPQRPDLTLFEEEIIYIPHRRVRPLPTYELVEMEEPLLAGGPELEPELELHAPEEDDLSGGPPERQGSENDDPASPAVQLDESEECRSSTDDPGEENEMVSSSSDELDQGSSGAWSGTFQ